MKKVKKFENELLYCMRYEYTSPILDRSLQKEAFSNVGELIYGRYETVYIDNEGRQWFSESLLSDNVALYFISNPHFYFKLLDNRLVDYNTIKKNICSVNKTIITNKNIDLYDIFEKTCESYILALKYVHMANLIVEIFYDKLFSLLSNILPLKDVNIYINSLFVCPTVKKAIEMRFVEDTRGTKNINSVKSDPVLIFADPHLWISTATDNSVVEKIIKSENDLDYYWALRTLTPIIVQLSEEFRYADYSIRTHLKYLLKKISLIYNDINEPYLYTYKDILNAIR